MSTESSLTQCSTNVFYDGSPSVDFTGNFKFQSPQRMLFITYSQHLEDVNPSA